jgi:hypothetical protein
MGRLKTKVELEGKSVREGVLRLTGNKAAHDEEGKQGFMALDTRVRAARVLASRGAAADSLLAALQLDGAAFAQRGGCRLRGGRVGAT